jgi:sulfonate transport system ATP-binding protein
MNAQSDRGIGPRPLLDIAIDAKHYGTRPLFAGATLQVGRAEIVSLVGPSGCGKSTLLRIAAGLDRDFSGTVALDGIAQHGPSPQVGVIFQEPRLLPWLDIANNVSFPARATHETNARVERLLAEVGLAAVGGLLPKQLSGGMAQRVAIARGLFSGPRLLLLDEPFSAVDAITRIKLQNLLLSVTRAHQMAALIVTHDLDEALFLSDRVLLMAAPDHHGAGRIVREFAVDAPRPRKRDAAVDERLRAELFASLEALVPA